MNPIVVVARDEIGNPLRGRVSLVRRHHRIVEVIPARDVRDHWDDPDARLPHDRQRRRVGEVLDRSVGVQVVEVGHHPIQVPDVGAQGGKGGITVGDIISPAQIRCHRFGWLGRLKRENGNDERHKQGQIDRQTPCLSSQGSPCRASYGLPSDCPVGFRRSLPGRTTIMASRCR